MFRYAPWADVVYGCDWKFWNEYQKEIIPALRCELWTAAEQAREQFGLYWIRLEKESGLNKAEDTINGGGNSGYQAVGLAYLWGAARIILLGYDMQRTGGKKHCHADHPKGLGNGGSYPDWVKAFNPLSAGLKQVGVEVVNCTRETALMCFKRRPLNEVLK